MNAKDLGKFVSEEEEVMEEAPAPRRRGRPKKTEAETEPVVESEQVTDTPEPVVDEPKAVDEEPAKKKTSSNGKMSVRVLVTRLQVKHSDYPDGAPKGATLSLDADKAERLISLKAVEEV